MIPGTYRNNSLKHNFTTVKLQGFAAHIHRHAGTLTSVGVTLSQIHQHLLDNVEGLTKISRSKVYNLLQPARANSEARHHKDAIDVRVGVKNCDISKTSPNVHEYFATVAWLRQICAEYGEECMIVSCDGKAKVHIGRQAVSHYQLRTFFSTDDMPHYLDHDFPVPCYLVQPDCYLVLQSKEEATLIQDKHGRDVLKAPTTGPLFLYKCCVKKVMFLISRIFLPRTLVFRSLLFVSS